jgi:hypothetical protein
MTSARTPFHAPLRGGGKGPPVLWRIARVCVALALVMSSAACGAGSSEASLDRAAFIGAWVDLRAAAAGAPDGVLPAAERARILEARSVREEHLVEFVEVHGADLAFMHELWTEVLDSLEARGVGEGGPQPTPIRPDPGA